LKFLKSAANFFTKSGNKRKILGVFCEWDKSNTKNFS